MAERRHEDKMYTPHDTKHTLDVLVSKICEKTQLMETTVRDLLSHGWMWQETRWVRQGTVVQVGER